MQSVYKKRKVGKSTVRKYRPKYGAAARITKRQAVASLANMRTGGYVGLEKKFFDTQTNTVLSNSVTNSLCSVRRDDHTWGTASTTNGALFCPGVGSGQSQRDGRQCKLDSIYSTIDCSLNFTSMVPNVFDHSNVRVYMALILDTQANGAAFDPAQVYRKFTDLDIDLIHPIRDLENIQRFRVLDSALIDIPILASEYDPVGLKWHVRANQKGAILSKRFANGLQIHFKGESLDVSDISDNNIGLVAWICDSWVTDAGAGGVELLAKTRCRFRG